MSREQELIELIKLAYHNLEFIAGRNKSSVEKALIDHHFGQPITGRKLVGPTDQRAVTAAILAAEAGTRFTVRALS